MAWKSIYRVLFIISIFSYANSSSAESFQCFGGVNRTVEILYANDIDKAPCKVVQVKNDNVETLWSANHDVNYCKQNFNEYFNKLNALNLSCSFGENSADGTISLDDKSGAPDTSITLSMAKSEALDTGNTLSTANSEAPDTGNILSITNSEAPDTGSTLSIANSEATDAGNTLSIANSEVPDTGNTLSIANSEAPDTSNTLSIANSCSYYGEDLPESVVTLDPDRQIVGLIDGIVAASGLKQNFEIKAGGVPNVSAAMRGADRYVLYNQSFIRDFRNRTGSDWAAISIMAHEVGHHLNGHTLNGEGSRHDKELEADSYSGFILNMLGAELKDALLAVDLLGASLGNSTHPAKSDRLAAIANGWTKACERNPRCSDINGDPAPDVHVPVSSEITASEERRLERERERLQLLEEERARLEELAMIMEEERQTEIEDAQ